MLALSKQGAGAAAPAKKDDVILRSACRQFSDEGSRAAPIYKRGAVPVRRNLL